LETGVFNLLVIFETLTCLSLQTSDVDREVQRLNTGALQRHSIRENPAPDPTRRKCFREGMRTHANIAGK
jgi:hypothetical protein